MKVSDGTDAFNGGYAGIVRDIFHFDPASPYCLSVQNDCTFAVVFLYSREEHLLSQKIQQGTFRASHGASFNTIDEQRFLSHKYPLLSLTVYHGFITI
jgi:hypothetical protein